jgi:hypothetical protein
MVRRVPAQRHAISKGQVDGGDLPPEPAGDLV